MSKGEIVKNAGEGKYTVIQKLAVENIQREIESLAHRVAELAVSLPEGKLALLHAEAAVANKVREIDSAIPDFIAGADGARDKITNMQVDLVSLRSNLRTSEIKVSELIAENLATLKRRNELFAVPVEREIEAWCADYSDDLEGSVGLVDINDEGGKGVIIQPGFEGNADYSSERDGSLFPNLAQSGPQIFFNAAILPGVQKWMPRYRKCKILALEGDLCTIELEPAKSSAQGLNINLVAVLHEVPIQYMDCNGGAFEVGDQVLLRHFKSGPQIVGFSSNPKPCAVEMIWRSVEKESAKPPNSYSIGRRARIGVKPLDIEFNYNRRDAICLYGNREYNLDNRTGVVFGVASFPSTWVIQDLAVFNNAVSGRKEVWVLGSERQQSGSDYDPDDEEWVKVRVFNDYGGFIEDRVLLTPPAYIGGGASIAASPHYYAFTSVNISQVRSIADNSVVLNIPWADAWPGHDRHVRTAALDITDELVVWTDFVSVHCRLLPSGRVISASIDLPYLKYTSLTYDFYGNPFYIDWGIFAVQLSNRTLTVFGSTRLINYRITRNDLGAPSGFKEISRHQFSEFHNYNIYASSDRSLLKPIPPA